MSFLKLLCLAVVLSTTTLFSEAYFEYADIIDVDSEPLAIFSDGFNLNVLTKGLDLNENGIYEEGEIKSQWLKYSPVGNTFESTIEAEFENFMLQSVDKYEFNPFTMTLAMLKDGELYLLKESTKLIEKETNLPTIEDFSFTSTPQFEKNLYLLTDDELSEVIYYSTDLNSIVGSFDVLINYDFIDIGEMNDKLILSLTSASGEVLAVDLNGNLPETTFELGALVDDMFIVDNSLKTVYDDITSVNADNNFLDIKDLELPEEQLLINTSMTRGINQILEFQDGIVVNSTSEIIFQKNNITEFKLIEDNLMLTNWNDNYLVFYNLEFEALVFLKYDNRDFLENYTLVNVGKQPIKSYWDEKSELLHVFCLGSDVNFNGEFDDGDENPSWWLLEFNNGSWSGNKARDFEFNSLQFPFKPAIDGDNDLLYIPHPGRVGMYDMLDQSTIDDGLWTGNAVAIDIAGPHLLFTVAGAFDENGQVIVYDDLNEIELQSIETEANPQKSLYFRYDDKFWFAVLNNGMFSDNKSILQVGILPHMQDPVFTNYSVGLTATDVKFLNGKLYVVANGSHQLFRLDLANEEIGAINVGSNGFDGPREIELLGEDEAIITSYSGILPIYDGEIFQMFPFSTDYRIENLVIMDGDDDASFAAAAPFFNDYSANNQMIVYGTFNTSVKEFDSKEVQKLSIFPAPVNGNFAIKIDGNIQNYSLEIFDISGNKIFSNNYSANRIDLNSNQLRLNAGTYFARVVNNEKAYSIKFNVQN